MSAFTWTEQRSLLSKHGTVRLPLLLLSSRRSIHHRDRSASPDVEVGGFNHYVSLGAHAEGAFLRVLPGASLPFLILLACRSTENNGFGEYVAGCAVFVVCKRTEVMLVSKICL